MTKEKNIFDKFIGKYSLSKTLRFELRPIWNTQTILGEEHVFETDSIRRKKYEETKPWIDRLHREFIQDALSEFRFNSLEPYRKAFEVWQKDKKSKSAKNALAKEGNKLREEIVEQFDATAKKWAERYPDLKLKKIDIGVLSEAGIFRVLKERYRNEEGIMITTDDGKEENIFDGWNGWTGYFKKFFQTRKNFYSSGDESTAIAYRIVNQNLRRFIQNIQFYEQAKHKVDIPRIEKSLGVSYSKVFSIKNYSNCILQDGIDTYNRVIGGYIGENDEKIPGINQAINEYRQKNKGDKIHFLAILDKQIHSEKEKFLDAIESDEELVKHLGSFVKAADEKLNIFRKLIADFALSSDNYDLNKIYISSDAFERNAGRWFPDYGAFERALLDSVKDYKDAYGALDQKPPQEKHGQIKYPDFLICAHIKTALDKIGGLVFKEKYYEEIFGFEKLRLFEQFLHIIQHEVERQFLQKDEKDKPTGGYKIYRNELMPIIKSVNPKIDRDTKIAIKNFADSALAIYQMAKYFAVEKKRRWLDNFELDDRFYNAVDTGYMLFYGDTGELKTAYEEIVKGYNALRNYLTKKPYSTDKWVLNFDIHTLADGWDKNKEKENGAVILRKDARYYLGIMHHEHKDIFTQKNHSVFAGQEFEKMEYRQIANPAFDIYNLIMCPDGLVKRSTKKETKLKEWPKNISAIYERKSYAKESFNRHDFETFIDYMKKCATGYWAEFNLSFSPTSSYRNISDFTREIDRQGYKLTFTPMSGQYLREKNEAGELFIFEIHNKDWNLKDDKPKGGAKNLHTLYWDNLFSNENFQENFRFKLNGEAELFFRPKTEKSKLDAKKDKSGKEVISHKRYAEDKILFHCPITLNRISENKTKYDIDADVRDVIINEPKVHIIGIDRGEKHLIYYSVVDQSEKIVEINTLNAVGKDSEGKLIEYAAKLEKRANDREASRRDWKEAEAIKDLKQGYISQVVHKLAELIIKYNAFIVFEDLNMRFKQIRGGIEKSVYQQLEKALIDKLSFLVRKGETNPKKTGHILRAYQLAAPVTAFKDMGKQTGIIFYTQAGYTSKTCPQCGYRRNIKCRFENIEQAKRFIKNLEFISYSKKEDIFTVHYSLNKLSNKEQKKDKKLSNELYAEVARKDIFALNTKDALRYKWYDRYSEKIKTVEPGADNYKGEIKESETKRGVVKMYDLTKYLKGLLETADIDYIHGDIKEKILSTEQGRKFYHDFLYALFLLTETRHSISGTDTDYIQCPECGFDSRNGFQGVKEFSGDANGAYNIARKGIMILEKIRQFQKMKNVAKMGWGELSISIEEWDKFVQLEKHQNAKPLKIVSAASAGA